MEAIKNSIQELTQHFNTQMAEFQQNLGSISATSPSSNIAAQFSSFRTFVLSALEGLQLQVELLAKQQDQVEMRSRRKMLLVHGIPEEKKEDVSSIALNVLSEHLNMPDLSPNVVSRCHRIGNSLAEKPRAILLKFKEVSMKNHVWFAKTGLKGTGITVSEFLTKSRHDAFMAARQHFGVSKCWTKDGYIIIIGSDGKRHRIASMTELNKISNVPGGMPVAAGIASTASVAESKQVTQSTRTKRTIRK